MPLKPLQHIGRLALLLVLAAPAISSAEDWPRWRGVRGDGTWQAPAIPSVWPEAGVPQVWKQPIGGGYGGIAVVGNRLYVMDLQKADEPFERILCLNTADGEIVWKHEYEVDYGDLQYANGPRATPTVFDGRVYTFGTMGHVYCLNADNGRVIWSHDLLKQGDATIPEWGLAASPVIYEELVIYHPGADDGCYIAFDRRNGAEVWRSGADPAGYCTPIIIEHQGVRQMIGWTPEQVLSLRPADGTRLWSLPYKVTYGVSIATPVFHRGIVFVTGYWEGSKAIALGERPEEVNLLWENNKFLRGLMCQPLCRNGYVYSLDKSRGLVAFEILEGEMLWSDKNRMTPRGRNPQANLVWLGESDRVIVLNSDGELILAQITPAGYEEQSRTKIIGKTWAHPAFAGKFAYARSDEEIVCVRLAD